MSYLKEFQNLEAEIKEYFYTNFKCKVLYINISSTKKLNRL